MAGLKSPPAIYISRAAINVKISIQFCKVYRLTLIYKNIKNFPNYFIIICEKINLKLYNRHITKKLILSGLIARATVLVSTITQFILSLIKYTLRFQSFP